MTTSSSPLSPLTRKLPSTDFRECKGYAPQNQSAARRGARAQAQPPRERGPHHPADSLASVRPPPPRSAVEIRRSPLARVEHEDVLGPVASSTGTPSLTSGSEDGEKSRATSESAAC